MIVIIMNILYFQCKGILYAQCKGHVEGVITMFVHSVSIMFCMASTPCSNNTCQQ